MEENVPAKPQTKLEAAGDCGGPPSRKTAIGQGDNKPKKRVKINRDLTVQELAKLLQISEVPIIKHLAYQMGIQRTVLQIVEMEIAKQLATQMGYEVSDLPESTER
jgi:hypothetical protein